MTSLYRTIKDIKQERYGTKAWHERLSEVKLRFLSDLGVIAEQEFLVDAFLAQPNVCLIARERKIHRNTVSRLLKEWVRRHVPTSS